MIESKRLCCIVSNTQRILPPVTAPWTQLFLIGSLSLPDSLCHLEHFLFSLPNAHTTVGCTTQHLLESGVEILLTVPRDQRQTSPWIIDWVDHAQRTRAGSLYRELWCKLASRTYLEQRRYPTSQILISQYVLQKRVLGRQSDRGSSEQVTQAFAPCVHRMG